MAPELQPATTEDPVAPGPADRGGVRAPRPRNRLSSAESTTETEPSDGGELDEADLLLRAHRALLSGNKSFHASTINLLTKRIFLLSCEFLRNRSM